MTAIVGVRCRDGIVLGTDSSATFGGGSLRTIEQPTDHKLQIISGKLMLAGTGQIGLGQRVGHVLEEAYNAKAFTGHPLDVATGIAQRIIANFVSTSAQKGQYGALLAYPIGDTPCLCEFAVADLQPELKDDHIWYCSMGSAQPITDPFLGFIRRVFWSSGPPSTSEGVFAVLWTLQQAIELNPGGVGGNAVVGVLSKAADGKLSARQLTQDELSEQKDAIDAAEQQLRAFRAANQAAAGADFPAAP